MYMRWSRLRVQGGATPTIKNHTATAVSRSELLVFGGYDGRHNHNELFLFDCEARSWRELTHAARGPPPAGRNGHTATLAEHKLFIIGGWLGAGPLAAADLHVLHLPSLTWLPPPRVRGTPPGPCNMHTADYLPHLRSILVFRGGDGREYLNDLHALSIDTMEWRRIHATGELPAPRANHSSTVVGDQQTLLVFGGWDGQKRLNDIHVLDTRCFTWSRVMEDGAAGPLGPLGLVPRRLPPHPRAGMTLAGHRGLLFLFGGSGPSAKCYNDLHVYDPAAHQWLDMIVTEGDASTTTTANVDQSWTSQQPPAIASGGRRRLRNTQAYRDEDDEDDDEDEDDDDVEEKESMEHRRMTQPYNMYEEEELEELDDDKGVYDLYYACNPNDTGHVPRPRRRPRPPIVVVGKGPGRRAGHTCTVVDRKLFIFGGSYGSEYLNDLYELDTDPPPRAEISLASSVQILQRSLRQFVNAEEFADISFLVEGRVVFGHKIILSLLSERFRGMFSSGFREASEKEIVVPDVRYTVFLKMMEYLYTGESVSEDRWLDNTRTRRVNSAATPLFLDGTSCSLESLTSPLAGGTYQQMWGLPRLEFQSPNGNEFHEQDGSNDTDDRPRSSSWPQEEPLEYDGSSGDSGGWQEAPQAGSGEDRRYYGGDAVGGGQGRDSFLADDELETTLELLLVADQFMLDHLKQLCERALQHAVAADTVECMLETAESSNAQQLRAVCLHYLRNHPPAISSSVNVFEEPEAVARLEEDEDEDEEEDEDDEDNDDEDHDAGDASKRLSVASNVSSSGDAFF